MNVWLAVTLFLCVAGSSDAYKIALFVPEWIASQLIWTVRVAEELTKAGHSCTIIGFRSSDAHVKSIKMPDTIERWHVDAFSLNYSYVEEVRSMMSYTDYTFYDLKLWGALRLFMKSNVDSCELILQNKPFLTRLTDAKFDLAFVHVGEFCGVGLVEAAHIPTWIWLNPGQIVDYIADYAGAPNPPSYVPLMTSDASDEMTFGERLKTFLGRILTLIVSERGVIVEQTGLFRKYIRPDFPDLRDVARACPLIMVNSNELYNLPRPTLHKIVYVGGLGMKTEDAKPLTGDMKEIVDRAQQVVVLSFGSHVNTTLMPEAWKQALLDAFRQFPEVEFIIRYPAHDLDAKAPKNVHMKSWLPQSDLLQHAKTAMLITHGGYNSVQEAIHSGVPLVAIPLFGDQPGNARLVEKHGMGQRITKAQISAQSITNAIRTVLQDQRFKKNVVRMRSMLRKKPSPPEALLVKWTEFVAEFKTLDNLIPYGNNLNFIQYHCLDVIALLFSICLIILAVILSLIRCIYRCVCKRLTWNSKKQKTH